MQRKELESLSREELVARAEVAGVVRPRSLTIPELIDELLMADQKTGADRRPRGWFGRARDLLTSVIDRGLHLPEPRSKRSEGRPIPPAPPPLPTVTLAEIYAAQGHLERAVATLDEVLNREPEHREAAALRARFTQQLHKTKPSTPPPVIEAKLEPMPQPAPLRSALLDEPPAVIPATPPVVPAAAEEGGSSESLAATSSEGDQQTDLAPMLEVDEIVALAVDPNTVYLYWEVRPTTLAGARAKAPDGALVVRALTVVAANRGPATDVRDFRVDALFGELFVHGLPPQANVRVSVGYKSEAGFEPFAIAMELMTPRQTPVANVAQSFRRWSEAGQPMAATDDPLQRGLKGQAERGFGGPTGPAPADAGDALTSRFPAGVWIDPSKRVVSVVNTQTGTGETTTILERVPGSSDLIRRDVIWASNPTWASNPAHSRGA